MSNIINGFDAKELSHFAQNLISLAHQEMPKECKKFMNKEGFKLRKQVREKSKTEVKKVTGSYHKGWRKGKAYKYRGNGAYAIRVYNNSPHAHFIEYGRRVKKLDGEYFLEGNHLLQNESKKFQDVFEEDVEQFVDDLLRLGLS